jgi:hypothetical protein
MFTLSLMTTFSLAKTQATVAKALIVLVPWTMLQPIGKHILCCLPSFFAVNYPNTSESSFAGIDNNFLTLGLAQKLLERLM